MTTTVRLISNYGKKATLIFNCLLPLHVVNCGCGIVSLECSQNITFYDFAGIVEGCFAKDTNFREEVNRIFGLRYEDEIKGIKCMFNGALICTATKKRHSRNWIMLKYHEYLTLL